MGIEVIHPIKIAEDLKAKLKDLEPVFDKAVQVEVSRMSARTRSGNDVNDQSFDPYSPGYAAFKKKKGRSASPVDLTFKGSMLRAITQKVFKQGGSLVAEVFFNSALESKKAEGNLKKRDFFGFSDEQLERIKRKIVEALGR
jgi:hypothetical protein